MKNQTKPETFRPSRTRVAVWFYALFTYFPGFPFQVNFQVTVTTMAVFASDRDMIVVFIFFSLVAFTKWPPK